METFCTSSNATLRRCMLATSMLLAAAVPAAAQLGGGPRPQTGDFFSSHRFAFWNGYANVDGFADFPVPGRVKVAELNTPLPTDRVFFQYSGYRSAIETGTTDLNFNPVLTRQRSFNEYLFGFEKTLFNDWWSVELRMPVFERVSSTFRDGDFVSTTDSVGNLAVILKRMLFQSDSHVMAIGLGFSTPTGGDSEFLGGNDLFRVNNESVHVLPYMMFSWTPRDRFFASLTVQPDVPLSGNRVEVQDTVAGGPPVTVGRLDTQSLLYVTATAGYWLYQSPYNVFLTGAAALVEVNYSTTLQELDVITGNTAYTKFIFDNGRSQFDIVNLSAAIDLQLTNDSVFRIAGVFPLNSPDQRFMDAEIKAGIVRSW